MSGMSVLSTKLHRSTELLNSYLSALESIESRGGSVARPDETASLLAVLAPLNRHLRGQTYFSLGVNGEDMYKFLHLRHREGWPDARDGILSIESRLRGGANGRLDLSGEDMSILGDVSDALDNVCASLFSEMRRR